MPNRDRVSEVYKNAESPAHERTRRRIDWMCEQASGLVLDLGCSQGIATILMARAGHTAVGVDNEIDRLEYAMADRHQEASEVAGRTAFVGSSGLSLPFPDRTFDTVVLGEVLEHLPDPEPFVAEAARVARKDGKVVVTVPFGYHPHHDHRHTFYLASFLDVVKRSFTPESIDIVDKYLHVVARPEPLDDRRYDHWILTLRPVEERALLKSEQQAFERGRTLRDSLERHKERVGLLTRQRDDWHRRSVSAEARIREFESTLWRRVRRGLSRATRRIGRRVGGLLGRSRRLGGRSRERPRLLFLTYVAAHRDYWPEQRSMQSDKLKKRLERWATLWQVAPDEAARRLFDMAVARSDDRPAPVYVTGLGGSGSHWVAGMLSELPGHASAREVYFAPRLLDEMRSLNDDEQGVVADAIHLLHSPPDPGAVDRSIVNCAAGPYKIPTYKRWDPRATVILLLRDPRDQVLSTTFRKPVHRGKVAPDVGDLEYLLQQCATSRRAHERYRALPSGADVEVTYEQLRADAAGGLRTVTAAVGHTLDDDRLREIVEEYDAERVRAGLSEQKGNLDQGGRAEGWRRDAGDGLRALVHGEIAEVVVGWGYSLCNCTGVPVADGADHERTVKLAAEAVGTVHVRGPGDDAAVWTALPGATEHTVAAQHAVLLRIGNDDTGDPADLTAMSGHVVEVLCLAGNTRVDDRWADAISGLEGLVELDLARTAVTDATLETLARHPTLQAVNVWDTGVTAEGVEAFRQANPRCRVFRDPPTELTG